MRKPHLVECEKQSRRPARTLRGLVIVLLLQLICYQKVHLHSAFARFYLVFVVALIDRFECNLRLLFM